MSGAAADVPPDLDITLEPVITAPHDARASIRQLLGGAEHGSVWDDAILATSEVVSLVLTQRAEPCRLSAWYAPTSGWLRVEVTRADGDLPNAMADADHPELDTLSLAVLRVVPEAWGIERSPFGELVWFEVTRAQIGASPPPPPISTSTPSTARRARTEDATRVAR